MLRPRLGAKGYRKGELYKEELSITPTLMRKWREETLKIWWSGQEDFCEVVFSFLLTWKLKCVPGCE